ncbi:MAG: DNA topoisomerase III, partial [Clostridia bacterium]|nr:DNA topoisomerase III [Clostridia bacterium]
MKLIIAEKPSLGRNIAEAIGQMNKRQGYLENDEYIVTWAFGHLFSLEDIEHYNPNPDATNRWTLANLPCFPKKFDFALRKADNKEPDEGVKRQFELISALCNRPDVDTIVNAGDADREGEIIVRLCIENALKSEKNLKRLWLPDQTAETIRQALSDMQDEAQYDNLANEGLARTYIDWLYGVNLTRYATIRTGLLLRVGRVIVPIVKAIYDRDKQIENFVPEIYYGLRSVAETNGEEIELNSKLRFSKDELAKAKAMCDKYNAETATVTGVKRKKDTIAPGKLYSLSKLQNVLSKKYKMNMTESLEIVQKLYEMGYLTYPRTNSEYLATAEKDKISKIVANFAKMGYNLKFRDDKTVFDDSKIESHSALTPTYKVPPKDSLTEKQMQVYSTVVHRFCAVFCAEPCLAEKTEIKINLG